MTFGWQGFAFDHPDDWAPSSLNGTFKQGYARLSSPGRVAVQVRWQTCKGRPDLGGFLRQYESRLRRDSARSDSAFAMQSQPDGEFRTDYRWTGAGQGRGAAFYSEACSRIFVLEVIGHRNDHLLPLLRATKASFRSERQDLALWSVLSLSVRIPREYNLVKHSLQAGKTQLLLSGPLGSLECTRWGFAEQLTSKYSLAEWSKAAMELTGASVEEELVGLRLRKASALIRTEALIRLQLEHNQIITLKSSFRRDRGRPQWEWIPG